MAPPPQVPQPPATPGRPDGRPRPAAAVGGPARSASRQNARLAQWSAAAARLASDWSLSFVGVLGYIFAAVTYRLPIVVPSIVVAILGLALERRRIVFPAFLGVFLLFLAWSAFGLSVSVDRAATTEQLTVIAKVFAIVFVITNVVRNPWRLHAFAIFFLACFAMYPARGTLQNYFIVGYTRFGRALWNYIYENSNDLAALTFYPLGLSVAVAFTEENRWLRRAAIVGTGMLPLIILLTQSRGALIALVASGLLFFMAQSGRARTRAMLIAAAAAIVVLPLVPSSAWSRFSGLSKLTDTSTIEEADPEGSAQARYNIWRVATTIIAQNPVAGIGLGAYERAHAMYAAGLDVPPAAKGFRDTHSTYLNVAAETGIPGLILFLGIITVVLVDAERTRRRAKGTPWGQQLLALELGLVGFLLAGVFGSFGKLSFLYLQLAFMWSLVETTKRELAQPRPAASPGPAVGGAPRPRQRIAAGSHR